MMTGKQQMMALKYAIAHLSDEIQTIDSLLATSPTSDFMTSVMTHKRVELDVDLEELKAVDKEVRAANHTRLDKEQWQVAWDNIEEVRGETEEDIGVEITWLDSSDEWVLNAGTELLEDGFISEEEAMERMNYVEQNYIQ